MRTNIVIDPKLIGEALRLSGAPTKRQFYGRLRKRGVTVAQRESRG
jgi:Arc/MetJ family transcription regulator